MRTSILWYQPEKLNDPDVVVFNGKRLPEGDECSARFNQLYEISSKAIKHRTPWCGMVEGYYFVKGYFDARDEKGRLLPFMFISSGEKEGKKALERELNALGYGMTADTISAIKRQARLPLIVAIAATVVIVALLAYLLNSCNN